MFCVGKKTRLHAWLVKRWKKGCEERERQKDRSIGSAVAGTWLTACFDEADGVRKRSSNAAFGKRFCSAALNEVQRRGVAERRCCDDLPTFENISS